ncbi:two-component system regulatory protein YycI [Ammoniphilus resinae]|uniref:Regulatory protein YycI of two-component signal transduction system YycFG n=1 Tax=Ammoniphilus resinae TaxID=861532 RepID=A0ABS4GPW3_9BACL|nr:two-component system regulatory protein YycI [Ammoniphilus resinae]MBP1932306.1 regulatory protein YycI of two-component signal transduction system YycFG [Ammoniphilus resinae]
MDWRRAKTLLIIAFLLLDSFLAFQLWSGRHEGVEVGEQFLSGSTNLQDVLQARGITLKVETPTDTPVMNYLNIKYADFRTTQVQTLPNQSGDRIGNVLQSRFHEPIPLPEDQREALKNRLKGQILFIDEYERDPAVTDKDRIRYLQQWNSYPLFGATLDLRLVDQRIVGYTQAYYQVVNKGSGKKVISSLTATRTLIENGFIKNGETIDAIDLGYYGHTYDAEIQVLAPVWRIWHAGKVDYVNGITGVIEKIPSLPKK